MGNQIVWDGVIRNEPAPQEVGDKGDSRQSYVPTTELSEKQVAEACAEAMAFQHRQTDLCTMAFIGSMWRTYQPWVNAEQSMALAERFPMIAASVFNVLWLAKNTSEGTFGRYREPIYKQPLKLLAYTIAARWRAGEKGRKTLG